MQGRLPCSGCPSQIRELVVCAHNCLTIGLRILTYPPIYLLIQAFWESWAAVLINTCSLLLPLAVISAPSAMSPPCTYIVKDLLAQWRFYKSDPLICGLQQSFQNVFNIYL
jgi:hypothetical protein